MSSTMLLGTLLKVQQFIHDSKVAIKKTSECNHKCMHDSYGCLFLPPEPT